jgi:hypothetical protein
MVVKIRLKLVDIGDSFDPHILVSIKYSYKYNNI